MIAYVLDVFLWLAMLTGLVYGAWLTLVDHRAKRPKPPEFQQHSHVKIVRKP